LISYVEKECSRPDSSVEAAVLVALERRPTNRRIPNACGQAKEGVLPRRRVEPRIAFVRSGRNRLRQRSEREPSEPDYDAGMLIGFI